MWPLYNHRGALGPPGAALQMARGDGFEPPLTGSEPVVLPLDDPRTGQRRRPRKAPPEAFYRPQGEYCQTRRGVHPGAPSVVWSASNQLYGRPDQENLDRRGLRDSLEAHPQFLAEPGY